MHHRIVHTTVVAALLCIMSLLTGCNSTFVSPYNVPGIRVDRSMFDVQAMKLSDSTVRLSFVTKSRIRTPDPIIRWVDAAIGPDENHLTDTITFSTSLSGEESQSLESIVIGEASWDTKTARMSKAAVADIGVVTGTNHIVFRQKLVLKPSQALDLQPFARRAVNGEAELGVMARRLYSPTGEYLPSSENFRVIVSDIKGNVVWRSDVGQDFMMAIGVVQPQVIGTVQQFMLKWNGMDMSKQQVPDGDYLVEFVIPARPNAYTARTTIAWPVR